MQTATLQRHLDRAAGQCTPPCWHAAHLDAARTENRRLQTEQADAYAHLRDILDKARAANEAGPGRADENGACR